MYHVYVHIKRLPGHRIVLYKKYVEYSGFLNFDFNMI